MPSKVRQKKIMEKLNRAQKMLNFGASKPRVKGRLGPWGPLDLHLLFVHQLSQLPCWPPRGKQVSHQRWMWGIYCKHMIKHVRKPSWLWASGQISPEVQSSGISGLTKETYVLQLFFLKRITKPNISFNSAIHWQLLYPQNTLALNSCYQILL